MLRSCCLSKNTVKTTQQRKCASGTRRRELPERSPVLALGADGGRVPCPERALPTGHTRAPDVRPGSTGTREGGKQPGEATGWGRLAGPLPSSVPTRAVLHRVTVEENSPSGTATFFSKTGPGRQDDGLARTQ